MVIVVGRIQSRKWQDQNGNNRTAIELNCEEVSFGETKKNREQNSGNSDLFRPTRRTMTNRRFNRR